MKGLVIPAKCTFTEAIDSYLRYHDLEGDDTANSPEECKLHCCDDVTCTMWQWSDDPPSGSNCIRGDSDNYDSSPAFWQGGKKEWGRAAGRKDLLDMPRTRGGGQLPAGDGPQRRVSILHELLYVRL